MYYFRLFLDYFNNCIVYLFSDSKILFLFLWITYRNYKSYCVIMKMIRVLGCFPSIIYSYFSCGTYAKITRLENYFLFQTTVIKIKLLFSQVISCFITFVK